MTDYLHTKLDRFQFDKPVLDAQVISPKSVNLNTYTPDSSLTTYTPDTSVETVTPDTSKITVTPDTTRITVTPDTTKDARFDIDE